MLRATLIFLGIGFTTLILGKNNTPGLSEENATAIAVIFFFLALMSLLVTVANEKVKQIRPHGFLKGNKKAHLKK